MTRGRLRLVGETENCHEANELFLRGSYLMPSNILRGVFFFLNFKAKGFPCCSVVRNLPANITQSHFSGDETEVESDPGFIRSISLVSAADL